MTVAELAGHFGISREAVAKWTTRGLDFGDQRHLLRPVDIGHRRARLYDLATAARFDKAARDTLAATPYHPGRRGGQPRPPADQHRPA